MNHHFICKCSFCRKVIAQCRCPSLNKIVEWDVCEECQEKGDNQ